MSENAQYVFGDVVVDLRSESVSRGGVRIKLEPKAFRLLVFLLDNQGRLVEKQEALDVVWDGAFVSENALTRAITQLRKGLGDEAKRAKYIETVPTRGYRFIAEVERRSAALPSSRWPLRYAIAAAVVLVFGSAVLMTRRQRETASPTTAPTLLRQSQLTTSRGLELHPAISPDGSAVAFSSDRSGTFEIYVRQLAPGG